LFGDSTAFVLRYRAIWDKLMGVVLLLLEPENYQKYCKSKSRKKYFCDLLKKKGGQWPIYAQGVSDTIETFDSRFRTAEAHGSGKLKKLIFNHFSADSNPLEDLFWATTSLNDQMIAFKKIFKIFAERGA
jgi:hypothetical protein